MKTFIRSVKEINNSNIIMYTTEDGLTKIEVTFDGDMDTIEISHNAKTRAMFAEGAISAAKFLSTQEKGFFNNLV